MKKRLSSLLGLTKASLQGISKIPKNGQQTVWNKDYQTKEFAICFSTNAKIALFLI